MPERGPDGKFLPGNTGRPGKRTKKERTKHRNAMARAASNRKVRVAFTPSEARLMAELVEGVYYKGNAHHRKLCANILRKLNGENTGGY